MTAWIGQLGSFLFKDSAGIRGHVCLTRRHWLVGRRDEFLIFCSIANGSEKIRRPQTQNGSPPLWRRAAAGAPAIAVENPSLSARRIEVSLPLSEPPDMKGLERLAVAEDEPEWRNRYARFAINAYAGGAVVPLRVHRWSLGPGLCLMGLEGEIFSDFSSWMDRLGADQGINPVPVSCVGGNGRIYPNGRSKPRDVRAAQPVFAVRPKAP